MHSVEPHRAALRCFQRFWLQLDEGCSIFRVISVSCGLSSLRDRRDALRRRVCLFNQVRSHGPKNDYEIQSSFIRLTMATATATATAAVTVEALAGEIIPTWHQSCAAPQSHPPSSH
ncbi:uncharacterized protein LOC112494948 isoform X2 [Cephus cinctus]|uniref:Uncharacterized protein LOC112494948 isoform X2 n=1 Tax=Cephus cinctus TaxID=211228 RepID=A0AAJ7RQD9_CEPCN|nr:uncharacterized protein LOC112494948 isoform X2 [Cephus cinctus]